MFLTVAVQVRCTRRSWQENDRGTCCVSRTVKGQRVVAVLGIHWIHSLEFIVHYASWLYHAAPSFSWQLRQDELLRGIVMQCSRMVGLLSWLLVYECLWYEYIYIWMICYVYDNCNLDFVSLLPRFAMFWCLATPRNPKTGQALRSSWRTAGWKRMRMQDTEDRLEHFWLRLK